MSEEINKIFEQWKQFLSWCYENNDKTTEIHRDNLERVMAYTRQLENIIKEVREDLDKQITFCTNEVDGTTNDKICRITIQYLKHLKQIVDKENKYDD